MPTTASAFLNALAHAGVAHIFANWGNDHPAILEELERQRVENGTGTTVLQIVTCPNEMVALSAAQGFTQVTGKPSVVIVHVDVGTQALAGAVHNVDRGRTPVLIFAGAAPFSARGELKGSKNEWPMWGQDISDQSAIVRQYMRYTHQLMSGKTVSRYVMRALQIATSAPQGPAYLWARREVFEEDLDESVAFAELPVQKWSPVEPTALPSEAVNEILNALCAARFPLIITANSGRNQRTLEPLLALSEKLAIALYMSCPTSVCVPYSHPNFLGQAFHGKNILLDEADVVIILDTDVPWIDVLDNEPRTDAKVFIIDPDPLKTNYGWSHVDADRICRADSEVALKQLLQAAEASSHLIDTTRVAKRATELASRHVDFLGRLDALECSFEDEEVPSAVSVLSSLRAVVAQSTPSKGRDTLWLNESISNYGTTFDHIRPDAPGSMLCSGGSSLGWALGAAVGAGLAIKEQKMHHDLVVAIVGDGTFMFCVPSSAFWMARKYNTPYLTVVINNGGWLSPKNSMMGVYPDGYGSKAPAQRLTTGFGPDAPDFAQIAAGAGGAWGRRVTRTSELKDAMREAIAVVLNEKRSAVLDCVVESI